MLGEGIYQKCIDWEEYWVDFKEFKLDSVTDNFHPVMRVHCEFVTEV